MAQSALRRLVPGAGPWLAGLSVGLVLMSMPPGAASEDEARGEANYYKLHPDLIVNVGGSRSGLLMVTVQVMSRNPETLEHVAHHDPALRHELLLLLADQEVEAVKGVAGREKLRGDALAAVNEVLERESAGSSVEALYFTNFIVE